MTMGTEATRLSLSEEAARSRRSGPPAPARFQRLRRRRAFGAAMVLVIVAADLVGSLLPRSAAELQQISAGFGLQASFVARAALAMAACFGLVAARGVRAGNRSAWMLAVAIGSLSAAAQVLRDATVWSSAACLVAVAVLLIDRSSYRVPGAIRLRGLAVPVGLAGAALVTAGLLEDLAGLPELTMTGWLALLGRVVLFLPIQIQPTTAAATAYLDSLRIVGALMWISLVAALVGSTRPSRAALLRTAEVLAHMNKYGRHSSIPLASLPGNDLVQLDNNTVVGGRLGIGTFIAVGGPVSADGDEHRAMSAFISECERWGVIPAVLDAAPRTAQAAEEAGLTTLRIGEEAFIDLADFSLAGKRRSNVRHSATRAQRDGLEIVHYAPDRRTASIDDDLRRISEAWLAHKHGPELGFTLGHLDLDRLGEQEMFVSLDRAGSAVAFVTWMPFDAARGAVLDLMRRDDAAPPGVMEFLISESLRALDNLGYVTGSLGAVPLASTGERDGALQRSMAWMYDHGGAVYEAKSLFAFKRKFDPRWEPIYLAYPSAADLPRVLAAIGRSFLPPVPRFRSAR